MKDDVVVICTHGGLDNEVCKALLDVTFVAAVPCGYCNYACPKVDAGMSKLYRECDTVPELIDNIQSLEKTNSRVGCLSRRGMHDRLNAIRLIAKDGDKDACRYLSNKQLYKTHVYKRGQMIVNKHFAIKRGEKGFGIDGQIRLYRGEIDSNIMPEWTRRYYRSCTPSERVRMRRRGVIRMRMEDVMQHLVDKGLRHVTIVDLSCNVFVNDSRAARWEQRKARRVWESTT